jgi:dTDP-4-amino-4,6-dideoxygalactose transaminase
MEIKIPFFDLDYGEPEEEAVMSVLRSRWLTMGDRTMEFEKKFAGCIGIKHAFAVSNCTVGLHLANVVLGIREEDEVICPSLSFAATANCIRYVNAAPVFADITSLDDWTLSPAELEARITPRTRAVIVMHYAGFACDMSRISEIASAHDLKIIEDCAHAPGSSYKGKMLGAWGDIACFSFYSNKNLSTGEGGMICTDDDALAGRIKLLRSHAMTSLAYDRHKRDIYTYDVLETGFNYRMDEIRAALGVVQLQKLERNNAKRRELAAQYIRRLSAVSDIHIPFRQYPHVPNYHLFPVLVSGSTDRYGFIDHLRSKGIQTSIHYPPIHLFTAYKEYFRGNPPHLPLTETIGSRVVTLPMHPLLQADQVDYICDNIAGYYGANA